MIASNPSAHALLSGHPYYIHWGVVQLSLTNFLIIVAMVLIFVLALVLPFPRHGNGDSGEGRDEHR